MFSFLDAYFLKLNRKLQVNCNFLLDFKVGMDFYTVVFTGFFLSGKTKK